MLANSFHGWVATFSILLVAATMGCGRMLDGKMYSLAEGMAMPMQIETSYGHGKMTADNPHTGEHFEGTYSAVRPMQTQVTQGWVNTPGGGSAALSGATMSASNVAHAIGTLIGDQGTVIDCVMQIQAGLSPHGIGTAKDKDGREYRIQF